MSEYKQYRNQKTGEIIEVKYLEIRFAIFKPIPEIKFEKMMCVKNDDPNAFTMCYSLDQFNNEFERINDRR